MENQNSTDPIKPVRYGWIRCEPCGGTGTVRYFRGSSAMVNHLVRGGDPTKLPCSDCGGSGRSWGPRS